MAKYIDKDALVAEIINLKVKYECGWNCAIDKILDYIDDLEVKDPYEQCVQYDSIKAGIQAHAETYSFNIESELFYQLTKEQQKLWRKEIEQACISGGEVGVELARDTRYKETLEVKEVDLDKEKINRNRNMIKVEEAAEKWRETYCPNAPSVYDAFIAGAKWQEEQSKCEMFEDLEEELKEWMEYGPHTNFPWCTIPDAMRDCAKHFFELGLKAQKGE